MSIKDAQANMRYGYFGGAPGLASSALIWLLAGLVVAVRDPNAGVIALILGGMLIHPLGVLGSKILGRPGAHDNTNPLAPLAFEGTVILLLCVLVSFALSRSQMELFFPSMLLVIGGRYLTFQTLYGCRVYWLCGGALISVGLLAAALHFPVAVCAFAGGLIEAVFALLVFVHTRRDAKAA